MNQNTLNKATNLVSNFLLIEKEKIITSLPFLPHCGLQSEFSDNAYDNDRDIFDLEDDCFVVHNMRRKFCSSRFFIFHMAEFSFY